MNLTSVLFVGLGGALGSIARFITSKTLDQKLQSVMPYGTLTVNIVGSLILGVLYGLAMRKAGLHENWRLFLGTGFCGGFTTFSTFAVENFNLLHTRPWVSFAYIILSLAAGLLAVGLGYFAGKSL